MGTSVNQQSPSTLSWRAVRETYLNPNLPVDRVVQEIWRAADTENSENLTRDLSASIVAECLRVSLYTHSPAEAIHNATMTVAFAEKSTLAADIAQRAVARSFSFQHNVASSQTNDRVMAFTGAVFAEAGDYLVSRDLPGFVGASERLKNVEEAITFKTEIKDRITEVVRLVELPNDITAPQRWAEYVTHVVQQLKGAAQ